MIAPVQWVSGTHGADPPHARDDERPPVPQPICHRRHYRTDARGVAQRADKTLRLEVGQRLSSILGIQVAPEAIERLPPFPLAALADEHSLQQFIATMNWAVDQITAA